ncbi:MAG TPA: class I SAM-dependent methyltransferase [Burkholderiaceae bacterium]
MNPTASLDAHAAAYTAKFAHFEENRIVHEAYGARLADTVRRQGLRHALSLGIGHSEVARQLLACLHDGALESYLLVDGAPAIIEGFRREHAPLPAGLDLLEGFFETFEAERQFDLIEAGFVLEHVEDPQLILHRLHGMLAPGGRLFVAVPNARSMHRLLGHEAGLLLDLYKLSDADLQLGHRRYYDIEMLRAQVAAAGFTELSAEGMLLKPLTTGQLNQLDLAPEIWQALMRLARGYPEISNAFCLELGA